MSLNIVEESFKNFIIEYNKKYNYKVSEINLGILCSCGVDSSVLLYVANKYKNLFNLNITILYVSFNDFSKSKQADELIVQLANSYKNKIKTSTCDLLSKQSGIKEAARKSMKELAVNSGCDLVLSAHHADDQIETVLFRIFRGSGIEGLKGMEDFSEYVYNDNKVLFGKPFLNIRKNEIIEYARLNDIYFIEDETNYNTEKSDRNYIRNNIIPLIENRFNINSIITTIKNIKYHLKEQNEVNLNIDIYSGKWKINDFINLSVGNRIFIIREYFRIVHGYNLNKPILSELRKKIQDDISNLYVNLNNGFIIARNKDYICCEYLKSSTE